MKRTSHARLVGVGREVPEYVDKYRTSGRVFSKAEIIERQLRGEPVLEGEVYGKRLEPSGTQRAEIYRHEGDCPMCGKHLLDVPPHVRRHLRASAEATLREHRDPPSRISVYGAVASAEPRIIGTPGRAGSGRR